MEAVILVIIWMVMGVYLYKRSIKKRWKNLKKQLIEQKTSLSFIILNTDDDEERAEAVEKLQKCDKAIKNLEKQWY